MTVGIIGGGVVGLCAAWSLRQRGVDVVVLEAGRIGGSASAMNAGWVAPTFSAPLASPGVLRTGLLHVVAGDGALVIRPRADAAWIRWLWDFRRAAAPRVYRDGVAALLRLNSETVALFDRLADSGVALEMHRQGVLALALRDSGLDHFRHLFAELVPLGFPGRVEHLTGDRARELDPAVGDRVTAAALTTLDRHVDPDSLLAGLHAHLVGGGAEVREDFAVSRLQRERSRWVVGSRSGDAVTVDQVVVALGAATNGVLSLVGARLPIIGAKGYSAEVRGTGAPPRHALYLCEAKLALSPYAHAVRVSGVFELPGREGGASRARAARLVEGTRPYLDGWSADLTTVAKVRSGLRPSTPDSLPYIGPLGGDGLYVAAGHGMLGLTLAPATGQALAGMICDGVVPDHLRAFRVGR